MSPTHIIILVFVGTLGLLLIGLGNFILQKKGLKNKLRGYYKYSTMFLIVVTAILFLLEKASRTRYVDFKLNDNIKIEVEAVERESFLDNPTDFTFSILNLNTNNELTFDYFTNNLYPFKFYINKENKNQLFIAQKDGPIGMYWIINLTTLKQENRNTEFLAETNFKLIEIATLSTFHKIELTKSKN